MEYFSINYDDSREKRKTKNLAFSSEIGFNVAGLEKLWGIKCF